MARPTARRGEGRERVLDAALALFAEHGVSGTSLQMIAERLGVTKAAVYFQFHTKDEIVLGVLDPALRHMAILLDEAEARPTREAQFEAAMESLVDLVVSHRRVSAILHGDPAVTQLMRGDEHLGSLLERLNQVLAGPEPTVRERVTISMIGGGLMLAGADPRLADLDEDTLRGELLRFVRAVPKPFQTGERA